VDTHRLKRGRGLSLAPEFLDQAVARDWAVPVQEQDREHGSLPPATKGHHPTPVEQLEWAQDPELHGDSRLTVAPLAAADKQPRPFIRPLYAGSILAGDTRGGLS
jgi:hypothetical protein